MPNLLFFAVIWTKMIYQIRVRTPVNATMAICIRQSRSKRMTTICWRAFWIESTFPDQCQAQRNQRPKTSHQATPYRCSFTRLRYAIINRTTNCRYKLADNCPLDHRLQTTRWTVHRIRSKAVRRMLKARERRSIENAMTTYTPHVNTI